ncbi:unnamed protein product [Dovyalis caffra]|uniref:Uncharacterized protein n=1 Tax=Dovyalis caffra TaxID=77055 RepID=A0AAV1R664_9ROSI|nr:unnamed protein product [Dovyalis caffra]
MDDGLGGLNDRGYQVPRYGYPTNDINVGLVNNSYIGDSIGYNYNTRISRSHENIFVENGHVAKNRDDQVELMFLSDEVREKNPHTSIPELAGCIIATSEESVPKLSKYLKDCFVKLGDKCGARKFSEFD